MKYLLTLILLSFNVMASDTLWLYGAGQVILRVPHSLLTVVICAILLLSVGCASNVQNSEIMIVDGCIVSIKGFSQTQADEIIRTLDIDPECSVEVSSDID